jgi:glyoxylase-like metal-dependent hydrolase (beta-lactamase superfamily II)
VNTTGFRFKVGDLTCIGVTDGLSAFPAAMVFGNAPEPDRDRALERRGLSTDLVESSLTSLVVESNGQRVLIDTGIGPFAPTTGHLPENLRASGIDPESIDVVILTHGHPDHIGGTIDAEGKIAFPNARYVMRRQEWAFWTDKAIVGKALAGTLHNLGELDQFMGAWAQRYLPPIRERLDLIEGEQDEEIVPGIYAMPVPGHTPYQMALTIASGDEQLLNLVDVAINPLHLEHPGWHPAFDFEPQVALETRRRVYDRVADEGSRILIYHFPFPGIGHVSKDGDGWRWEPEQPEPAPHEVPPDEFSPAV